VGRRQHPSRHGDGHHGGAHRRFRQTIYNVAPQSDIGGVQQVVLGKKAQEIVKSPKDRRS